MDSIQTGTGNETHPLETEGSNPTETAVSPRPEETDAGDLSESPSNGPEQEEVAPTQVEEPPLEASSPEPSGAEEEGEPPVEAAESEPVDAAEERDLPVEASGIEPVGAEEQEEPPTAGSVPEPVDAQEERDAQVDGTEPEATIGAEAAEQPAEAAGPEPTDAGEMGELAVEDWDYQRPRRGEIRQGIILSVEEQEIIVDVDAKRDGIVPFADMQRLGAEAVAALSPGDEVDVFILRPEDKEGNLIVSLFQARQAHAWTKARELAEGGDVFEGKVIGYNKGGLVVPVGEIRGFVPASQVPGFPQGLSQDERLRRLSEKVGETLQMKVIEINRRSRRLILSATAAQREWRAIQRKRLLEELREGEVRKGKVSSLCSFGAFVDLGGADGLVHISELSWRRVRHPREVVAVGEEVEVFVLRLDTERKRIGLSLKRLQPEPWALVEDKYELGQLVEGVVTNVVDFGAFAEIEDGVEGLIHVSELSEQSISHPRDVVKKGDLLLLRIIRIDIRRKRLGLSLKRVLESEWAEWAARLAAAGAEEGADSVEEDSVEEKPTEQPAQALAEEPGTGLEPEEGQVAEGDSEILEELPDEEEVEALPLEVADDASETLDSGEPEDAVREAIDDAEQAVEELELETASL